MASLVQRLTIVLPRCELPIFKSTVRPSPLSAPGYLVQQTEHRCDAAAQSFSTTQCLGPRQKSRSRHYPGFRNESKDQRLVREHKLFDPFSFHQTSALARLAGPESLKKRTTQPVAETSSAELEREMLYLAAHSPPGARVLNVLDQLVAGRGEHPNASHYEALIHANASPDRGSANNVRDLLQEMDKYRVPMNVNTYTAVLRTLVVHPDPDLLDQVIDSCERMWIPLDSEMLHFISAAYLRADMPELAMEYFDLIEGNVSGHVHAGSTSVTTTADVSGKVELWLYVLLIAHLTKKEDWEGVIRLCYRLNDDISLGIPLAMRQIDIPYVFWSWLLDRASIRDRWVSLWVWDRWVRTAWIKPSLSTCKNMLELCARHGLHDTAESTIQLWKKLASGEPQAGERPYQRGTKHNGALSVLLDEAYLNAGPDVRRMAEREKQKLFPHWQLFNDDAGIEKDFGTPMRIDPWASLPSEDGVGKAWPNVIWERQAEQKRKEETDQNRRMAIQEKQPGEIAAALRHWPGQLQDDLQALASLDASRKGLGEAQGDTATSWIPLFVENNESGVVEVQSPASTLNSHTVPSCRALSDVNDDSGVRFRVTVPANNGKSVSEADRDDQTAHTSSYDRQFTQDLLSASTPPQRQENDSNTLGLGVKTEIMTASQFFECFERDDGAAEDDW